MPVKRFIVLANSIKKGGRCIAGRELIEGPPQQVGPWLRPISNQPEGELMAIHVPMSGEGQPRVLDIVDVSLDRATLDPVHPEDWLLPAPPAPPAWRRDRVTTAAHVARLIETPPDLWLQPGERSDRTTGDYLRQRPNHQSLYLIRPERLQIETTRPVWDGVAKLKTHARFTYRGTEYRFSMTDPAFTAAHHLEYPEPGGPAKRITPPCGDACVLCVSLTPVFEGHHYKVVATIIPTP